jgi:hypothetical protein
MFPGEFANCDRSPRLDPTRWLEVLFVSRWNACMAGQRLGFVFTAQFANWHRLNRSSANLFDDLGAGTFVNNNIVHDFDIRDVHGVVVNDGSVHDCVIYDHGRGAHRFQEAPFFDNHKRAGRDDSQINRQ